MKKINCQPTTTITTTARTAKSKQEEAEATNQ